jgi:hypothetical protein
VVGIEGRDKWFETFVNPSIVKLVSSRSPGSNCKSQKCWVQDVYHGTQSIRI